MDTINIQLLFTSTCGRAGAFDLKIASSPRSRAASSSPSSSVRRGSPPSPRGHFRSFTLARWPRRASPSPTTSSRACGRHFGRRRRRSGYPISIRVRVRLRARPSRIRSVDDGRPRLYAATRRSSARACWFL